MTTQVDGTKESRSGSDLDYAVLAAGVAAEVKGPRGPEPERDKVADALARRAAGATYEAIAEAVGISAKRAAEWCRAAARIEPSFDARGVKPRKIRKEKLAQPGPEKILGWRPNAGTRAAFETRAASEKRSLSDLLQSAADSYLGRKVAGVDVLVRRELRKNLKAELRAVADAVSAQSVEIARWGNNVNQVARFCNKYKQLPVNIAGELQAARLELEANRAELARLSAAVEDLIGGDGE